MGYTGKQGGYRPQTGSGSSGNSGGGGNWASKSRPAPVAPVQNNQAAAATDDDSYLVSTFLASKKVGNQHYTRVDERTLENLKKIAVGDMIIFGLSKKEEAKFPAYMKVLPSTTK
jgi:hypothetical protein